MSGKTNGVVAFLAGLAFVPALLAAPAGKGASEPVAPGYPAWSGVVPKNHILGRALIGGADLRQHATVVVEFDADKAAAQLEETGSLTRYLAFTPAVEGAAWESLEIPHGTMVIYVARNFTTVDVIKDAMKVKDQTKNPGLIAMGRCQPPMYHDVTFEGAPSGAGQYPYVYVMGTSGTEPLYKGKFDKAATMKGIRDALKKDADHVKEESLEWRPYYGYVSEPKHFGKDIEKTLAKGKPTFEAVEAKLLKGVQSKDEEVAKEAQMLYDGLQQTKSDMMYIAFLSFKHAPHVAAYKAGIVMRLWPKMKKMLADVQSSIKSNGDAAALVKIYPKVMTWADPAFTCKNAGEAKKIVVELNKMKKMLQPLKEDAKNISVQNGALMLDGMLDELISTIPARVATK